MKDIQEIPLAKLVLMKPQSAGVFEKYNLDFCCRGKQSLSQVLEGNDKEMTMITNELNILFADGDEMVKNIFEDYSLCNLIDHIINTHHRYVKENGNLILGHLEKVAQKHGERHPEMIEVASLFKITLRDLEQHMIKEEIILFPRIKTLETNISEDDTEGINISTTIKVMETEHEIAGDEMYAIRELTNNYTPPLDACTTYKLSYEELRLFEIDLHQHVHLENNILFPKALKLKRK
ncbi:MAG: iron-sulfur cluster repair di-iron protein [Bacteroidota bacterium]